VLKTAGYWTITATDVSVIPTLAPVTSSPIRVSAGAATQLQALLPGETADPGNDLSGTPGKTGTPTAQVAGIAFTATVNAVDSYWNVVTTAAPTVAITASDTNAVLPANAALSGGTRSFTVALRTAGAWTVTATDQATPSPLTASTSASVTVNAGAATQVHVVLAPTSIATDAISTSTATVTVTDLGGNPVAGETVAVTTSGTGSGQQTTTTGRTPLSSRPPRSWARTRSPRRIPRRRRT
jgi:hypothetical protein